MGIGVSLGNLAGHVALQGAMGSISSVNISYRSEDFWQFPLRENIAALKREIQKALTIADGNGLVAMNIMVATTRYTDMVKAAVESGVQAIISGAGLPFELPALTKNTPVAVAPIVSSGRAARLICTKWDRNHQVIPDFIVIEGSEAGGHLGFSAEDMQQGKAPLLEEILIDVQKNITPFEEKYQRQVPLFVAGGIRTGADIARCVRLGASGTQMATRFIATEECDASEFYKQVMVNASSRDAIIIKSPVGMPGRALKSPLVEKLDRGETIEVGRCIKCLETCDFKTTPYCISKALINAVSGNWEEGLFFCGSQVENVTEIVPVAELIKELRQEWEAAE
jgi:NAD(P)H-dependent flavin oxidoreductase YrpB (nitropropane dioxygenase family)